jgi:diguanylate cyclase (GGDEF)-like protein
LLLLPEMDKPDAVRLAERLRLSCAQSPIEVGGQSVAVTASFGVLAVDLTSGDADVTEEAIIAAADKLLYRAKTEGRNNIQADSLLDGMGRLSV